MISAITNVFTEMGSWLVTAIQSMLSVFATSGTDGTVTLTFLGVLAVAGLGLSIMFLVIGLIQNFLHFRG